MQSLGLTSLDARDEYVGKTLQGCAYSYRKSADGKQRPVAQVLLVHDLDTEFVVHIFQSDADPQFWFKDLCFHIDGRDELCSQIPEIRFRINRKSKKGSEGREGLNAVPAPLAEQTPEMQTFLQAMPGTELMTIVRVAARRAGYEDDTPSASYSPFINAVLWEAAEEGLLFRVRHATIDSKSGDAHYSADS